MISEQCDKGLNLTTSTQQLLQHPIQRNGNGQTNRPTDRQTFEPIGTAKNLFRNRNYPYIFEKLKQLCAKYHEFPMKIS